MNSEVFRSLCDLDGVSGREDAVRQFILDRLATMNTPMEIHADGMGNVVVHLIGKKPAEKRVLFDAHMDEVGLMITHVCADGRLRFDTVGGISPSVLYGRRVRIGHHIGVIGGKAIHQTMGEEKTKVPAVESMVIDIGATDERAAADMVRVGDTATFESHLSFWDNGLFMGKAVDDRVGCALLLELTSRQPERDIWLSFSVQEEVGLRGAGVVAEVVRPDIAVAIDATTAADIAGAPADKEVCRLGDGAVVSFADRSTLYDSNLYHRIRRIAQNNRIPTQTKNCIAGGNNAGAIQRAHIGVAMAAVSLPCRYIHSPSCVGSMADVEAMEQLLFCLAEQLPL